MNQDEIKFLQKSYLVLGQEFTHEDLQTNETLWEMYSLNTNIRLINSLILETNSGDYRMAGGTITYTLWGYPQMVQQ